MNNMKHLVVVCLVIVTMALSCSNTRKGGDRKIPKDTQSNTKLSTSWKKFRRAHGQWTVDWNEATGTPHRATGPAIRIPGFPKLTEQNVEKAAMKFLSDNHALLGIELGRLKLVQANEVNGRWYVSYKQIEHGLEVLKSEVELRIFRDGRVMAFGSDFFQNIDTPPAPTISLQSAQQHAVSALDYNPETDSVAGDSTLYYLPLIHGKTINYHLVYRVEVKVKQPLGNYNVLVDAHSGEIREHRDLVRYRN